MKFKNEFRERFKDVRTDQYNFTKLQTVRQARNEGPREFADHCKALAQKVMFKVKDPVRAAYFRENAERMCLAGFVAGLVLTPGRQVRFSYQQIMRVCLKIALTVQRPKNRKKLTKFSLRGLRDHQVAQSAPQVERFASTKIQDRHLTQVLEISKINVAPLKKGQTLNATKVRGHLARECPTRLKRE